MSYSINGNNLSAFSLTILKSEGALDVPGRIGDIDYNWGDTNGIQAFTSANDLKWNGRKIVLSALYYGSNLAHDVEQFKNTFAGSDLTLLTTYGTFSVRLVNINVEGYYRPNRIATIDIILWQAIVSNSAPVAAIGGTGVTIGGYDFKKDFGLTVRSVKLHVDTEYSKRSLSGLIPQYNNIAQPKKISFELNGLYLSISNLISNVEKLKNVLMSPGLKQIEYVGNKYNSYFADTMKVSATPIVSIVNISLTLRIQSTTIN